MEEALREERAEACDLRPDRRIRREELRRKKDEKLFIFIVDYPYN
jgi:hypothetical protein